MPVLFLLLALGAIGWLVLTQRTVLGYVGGVPVTFEVVAIGGGARLRPDAAYAWLAMQGAAARDGVALSHTGPRSGFRTPEEQQQLIEEQGSYGSGGFAAAVNHSPHQAGRCLDISVDTPEEHNWMRANAPSFGWLPTGESFSTAEPWHFEFRPGLVTPGVS